MFPTSSSKQGEVEGWLLGKVRRPPPPEAPEIVAFMRRAEGFLRQYLELRKALSGRFRLVRFVLSVFQRPRSQWPAALADLREDHAGLARAMLDRLVGNPELIKLLLIANDRFDDASRAAAEVRAARGRVQLAPPELRAAIAAKVDFPKLNGRLYLLSNFDVTFRDDPVLGKLFPPIDRERRPKTYTPPPAPVKPPDSVGQAATKLSEGIERLMRGR